MDSLLVNRVFCALTNRTFIVYKINETKYVGHHFEMQAQSMPVNLRLTYYYWKITSTLNKQL